MTMVRPKTTPWRSNQKLCSTCMDRVLQNSHDDKLTISLITLASACSYGHKNKISISSRIHIGGMAPVYHSHSPHTVGQKWPTIQHNTVVSIMHRELSVTLGHTKLPVPKSLSHQLPQSHLPTNNFIAHMSHYQQLRQRQRGYVDLILLTDRSKEILTNHSWGIDRIYVQGDDLHSRRQK